MAAAGRKGGPALCSDEAFNDRLARAGRSKHSFIYAAADNEDRGIRMCFDSA